ncbi:UDP-N-acetylmuramate dehydrogenase [Patescibacteria group bacterium]|nr:UDP-N-acetylmuramate dehydrogenase [Patescibacteria group bacterium]
MNIKKGQELKKFTTFGIGGKADFFVSTKNIDELKDIVRQAKKLKKRIFVLGGGSNILVSDRGYRGLVLHLQNKGINILSKNSGSVVLKIEAGEIWDDVVEYAVKNKYWGIENLSHIPGQAGAGAVQNIGAYGQELKDVLDYVEVFDTKNNKIKKIKNKHCGFGYRKSIFNSTEKGRYVIIAIVITLSRRPKPILKYKDLKTYFENKKADLAAIRKAVIKIRDDKFPFPTGPKNGSAGSFFKNITVPEADYKKIHKAVAKRFGPKQLARLENIVHKDPNNRVKIPTAFLIDLTGFKGKKSGGAKINEKQPLVILNTGKATSSDVLRLAKMVKTKLHKFFGVRINIEPELVGFMKKPL